MGRRDTAEGKPEMALEAFSARLHASPSSSARAPCRGTANVEATAIPSKLATTPESLCTRRERVSVCYNAHGSRGGLRPLGTVLNTQQEALRAGEGARETAGGGSAISTARGSPDNIGKGQALWPGLGPSCVEPTLRENRSRQRYGPLLRGGSSMGSAGRGAGWQGPCSNCSPSRSR